MRKDRFFNYTLKSLTYCVQLFFKASRCSFNETLRSFRPDFNTPFNSLEDIWSRLICFHAITPEADDSSWAKLVERASARKETPEHSVGSKRKRSVDEFGCHPLGASAIYYNILNEDANEGWFWQFYFKIS
jgi:hypothetical protein